MSATKHFILFLVGIIAWLVFYLIGLPSNYFTEWSLTEQILISLITFFSVVPVSGCLILIFYGGNYRKTALWAAFYASVPGFCLDYAVIGLGKDEGLNFLFTHWYLTIAYIYVWLELPLIALAVEKLHDHSAMQKA